MVFLEIVLFASLDLNSPFYHSSHVANLLKGIDISLIKMLKIIIAVCKNALAVSVTTLRPIAIGQAQ